MHSSLRSIMVCTESRCSKARIYTLNEQLSMCNSGNDGALLVKRRATMKVRMRNPDRVEEVQGVATVKGLLELLAVHPDSVLVIRGDTLLTRDERLDPDDEIELRPVVSGGFR